MYDPVLNVVSAVFVCSGLLSVLLVGADLRRRPQPMRIMNSVWVLTALWGGFLALWAYYSFGRASVKQGPSPDSGKGMHPAGAMFAMDMKAHGAADGMPTMETDTRPSEATAKAMDVPARDAATAAMTMGTNPQGAGMSGMLMSSSAGMPAPSSASVPVSAPASAQAMTMDMPRRPLWQSVLLSSLHCGAGCTLADLIGEWFAFFVPVAIGGSLLAGSWVLDYVLALLIGVGFQYAAIQAMGRLPRKSAVGRAIKADFLSLTAWQVGMYAWMTVAVFGFFGGVIPSRDGWTFWFMMQLAMLFGFLLAYPVNRLLIRYGIKKPM